MYCSATFIVCGSNHSFFKQKFSEKAISIMTGKREIIRHQLKINRIDFSPRA